MRTVFLGGVSPAQPIAIDKDNTTLNSPIIKTKLAVRLREKRGELGHLLVGQPTKVAHVIAPFLEP